MATTAVPLTIGNFRQNFPNSFDDEIVRSNLTHTIFQRLDDSLNDIVFLDGPEGIGRTTLLKQFCEQYNDRTFSCFLNPFSLLSYNDLAITFELYHQIYWFLHEEEDTKIQHIGLEEFRYILQELRKYAAKTKGYIYFVIDGLEAATNDELIKWVFSMLPVRETRFKFVITGRSNLFTKKVRGLDKFRYVDLIVIPFSPQEATKYLNTNAISRLFDERSVSSLYSASSNGMPGMLSNLKRHALKSDKSVDQLLDSIDNLNEIYDLEWNKLKDINDALLIDTVSIVAIDVNQFDIATLSQILSHDDPTLRNTISKFDALFLNTRDEPQFYSASQKKFFAKKLESQLDKVTNTLIGYHLTKEDGTIKALVNIPNYFESLKKWNHVVDYLSGDYLTKIVQQSQSLVLISRKIDQGYNAAVKLQNEQVVKFSLQRSAIQNIDGLHTWENEIDARINLGEFDVALKLAEGALLVEVRFALILKIAAAKAKKGMILDDGLIEQIKTLATIVDFEAIGEKAFEMAADLMYSVPKLGIDILNRLTESKPEEAPDDKALTSVRMSVLDNKVDYNEEKFKSLLKDTQSRSFTSAIASLIKKYSIDEMLFEAEKLADLKAKLFIVKVWVENNADKPELGKALEYGVAKCQELNSIQLLPAETLLSLTAPLYKIQKPAIRNPLVKSFSTFDQDLKEYYPTVQYVEFKLNLVRARISGELNLAMGDFTALTQEMLQMEDLVTKGEALALLYSRLVEMEDEIPKSQGYLFKQLASAVKDVATTICKSTGEHFINLKGIVATLSVQAPLIALRLAKSANTLDRREQLMLRILDRYCNDDHKDHSIQFLFDLFSLLTTRENKDLALVIIFISLSRIKNFEKSKVGQLLRLYKEVKTISATELRCKVMVSCLRITAEKTGDDVFYAKVMKDLEASWLSIKSEIRIIDVGFLIASDLSTFDSPAAIQFLKTCDDRKKSLWVDSPNTLDVYNLLICLLIKIFSGLIPNNKFTNTHLDVIDNFIRKIPSNLQKVGLYAFLSHQFLRCKDLTNAFRIINESIKPIISSIDGTHDKGVAVSQCCELMFLENQLTTIQLVDQLSEEVREQCYCSIIQHQLTKQNPAEIYSPRGQAEEIEFSTAQIICTLLEKVEAEHYIYTFVETIIRSYSKHKQFSKPNRAQLYDTLFSLAARKFPSRTGVQHNGYRIITQAQLLKFKENEQQKAPFDALIKEAELVPNTSDRAFVLSVLSDLATHLNVGADHKSNLLKTTMDILGNLHCDIEYINMVTNVTSILTRNSKFLPSQLKENITSGFKLGCKYQTRDIFRYQQRLLDMTYRYDKQLAKSLFSYADTDEARMKARYKQALKEQMAVLETQGSIDDLKTTEKESPEVLSQACANALSELNSGLLVTKKPESLWNLFEKAKKLSLMDAVPIYGYYVENLVERSRSVSESPQAIQNLFESTRLLCSTLENLAVKQRIKLGEFRKEESNIFMEGKLIRAGERDIAFKFIKQWLSENLSEYVKICDAYFEPSDLTIVKTILEIDPGVTVDILTSHESKVQDLNPIWMEQWRTISSQDPPHTKVSVIVSMQSRKTPFHDRCLVSKNGGLRIGTSLGAIGKDKESEISIMQKTEKEKVEHEILDQYLSYRITSYKDEKLDYKTFKLT